MTGEPDARKPASPVRRGTEGKGLHNQNLACRLPYNILHKALDGTVGQTGTSGLDPVNAWGELTATVVPVMAYQQVISWNQEPPVL